MGDFGLSRRFEPGSFMATLACTPSYVAPEVLEQRYTESCDIWSLGVLTYVLLSGSLPFIGDTEVQQQELIKSGQYNLNDSRWASKTAASKDLIRRMLSVDPSTRIN